MWEGPKYIPYDPDEVYLDFSLRPSILPTSTSKDLELLLVASKREAVDERKDVLENVNLNPVICDVEALAILNMVSLNNDVQTHQTYCLANIHGDMLNVAVVVKGEVLLLRDVNISSDSKRISTDSPLGYGNFVPMWEDNSTPHKEDMVLSHEEIRKNILSELKRTMEGAWELLPDLNPEIMFSLQ